LDVDAIRPTPRDREGSAGSSVEEVASARVPPLPQLSPKLQSSLSSKALANLARSNFSIGTPPHTPNHAPTVNVAGIQGEPLALSASAAAARGRRLNDDFSNSNSMAPLGAPARRVDTDDELLQQQVLWEVELPELDFTGQKLLGRGAYGEVVLAKWRSLPVAIKRCVGSEARAHVTV